MKRYTVQQAKAQFERLIAEAREGEQIVIEVSGDDVFELVRKPSAPPAPPLSKRTPGSARGQIWMAPDFDAPLDDFDEYTR